MEPDLPDDAFEEIDLGRALLRPLFEELTDEHYRESALDGPYGFLIGGMALPTKDDLARQYFDAGNQLLECIRRREVEDFTLANPILFLYRHSIEMLLKSRLQPAPTIHGLTGLVNEFAGRVKDNFQEEVPSWIMSRIKELDSIDPSSTAFRYGEIYDKNLKLNVAVDGEIHVDLHRLQQVMTALHEAFANVPIGIKAAKAEIPSS